MIDIHVTQSNHQEYDPYRELAMAIIRQAASDYRACGRKLRQTKDVEQRRYLKLMMKSIAKFFLSDWYSLLNKDDNGPFVLKALYEEAFGVD